VPFVTLGEGKLGFGVGREDLRGFYRLGEVERKGFGMGNVLRMRGEFKGSL